MHGQRRNVLRRSRVTDSHLEPDSADPSHSLSRSYPDPENPDKRKELVVKLRELWHTASQPTRCSSLLQSLRIQPIIKMLQLKASDACSKSSPGRRSPGVILNTDKIGKLFHLGELESLSISILHNTRLHSLIYHRGHECTS
jgi:hypothetical protein